MLLQAASTRRMRSGRRCARRSSPVRVQFAGHRPAGAARAGSGQHARHIGTYSGTLMATATSTASSGSGSASGEPSADLKQRRASGELAHALARVDGGHSTRRPRRPCAGQEAPVRAPMSSTCSRLQREQRSTSRRWATSSASCRQPPFGARPRRRTAASRSCRSGCRLDLRETCGRAGCAARLAMSAST